MAGSPMKLPGANGAEARPRKGAGLKQCGGAGNRSTAEATPREASGGNQLTESRRPTKEQSPPGAGVAG
jgi:hypothetical protein